MSYTTQKPQDKKEKNTSNTNYNESNLSDIDIYSLVNDAKRINIREANKFQKNGKESPIPKYFEIIGSDGKKMFEFQANKSSKKK